MLTNTGESLIYVSLLLIGMHTLFNFKIDKFIFGRQPNRVAPERNYGSESGSKNSVGNLSIALNRTLRLVRQQSGRITATLKVKPIAFEDFRQINSDVAQKNIEG